MSSPASPTAPAEAPPRPRLVLTALILGALVCNINLAAANIALPDIGDAFGAGQTALNLVAVGCSLGLAMSVLYLGAVADRYGRKQLLVLGLALTVVVSFFAAFAASIEMLVVARICTGIAAGMAYPVTLSLITALWAPGRQRTLAIALWSAVSATATVIGSVLAGILLLWFWWGAAFFLAVPFAVAALVLVVLFVPSHVAENSDRVDHLGGVLSVFMVACLVLGLSTVFVPTTATFGLILLVSGAVLLLLFGWRQRRARSPLYDLRIARRRMFWAPATGGLIVFGSLMGAMFVGQQFQQNILGYSTLDASLSIIPAGVGLLLVAPHSARLVLARGSRFTMLLGYGFVLLGFITMLFWNTTTPFWWVTVAYLVIGIGAGFAMTPASRAITESTPVRRVGMASATADLQRDLGGSIMQGVLGAILAAGFARSFGTLIAGSDEADSISAQVVAALQASYASAMHVAEQYPQYKDQIVQAAQQSLVDGAIAAYAVGAIAIALGAVVVGIFLPRKERELALVAEYEQEDAGR
ncbi:MFS transporter [Microbacterium aurantiacum]|uniref:Major facilitator transporter n=1 Tax=Microbacterium aurantiacum TaxID=162393 RepID=A0A0M9VLT1_9MICO|nr:MFS transporter [Microbacterium chocolatum]ANG85575.1 MFS transporter [Microbacterium chocolatum]KOS11493.1 major facilitator transporter [Microbacterium chocolatum]